MKKSDQNLSRLNLLLMLLIFLLGLAAGAGYCFMKTTALITDEVVNLQENVTALENKINALHLKD